LPVFVGMGQQLAHFHVDLETLPLANAIGCGDNGHVFLLQVGHFAHVARAFRMIHARK